MNGKNVIDIRVIQSALARHSAYYLDIIKRCRAIYNKGGLYTIAALQLFDQERENIDRGHLWAIYNYRTDERALRFMACYSDEGVNILAIRLPTNEWIKWLEYQLMAAMLLNNKTIEGKALGNLGTAFYWNGETGKAIMYHKMAVTISRDLKDQLALSGDLNNLGVAFSQLGDLPQSIICYEEAIKISRLLQNDQKESNILGNLGMVHKVLGQLDDAIKFHSEALIISRRNSDKMSEAHDLCNLGNALLDARKIRDGIECIQLAQKISLELNDKRGVATALGFMAHALLKQEHVQEAIKSFEQQLSIAREIGAIHMEALTLGSLGDVWGTLGRRKHSIGLYKRSLALFKEIGDIRLVGQVANNLAIELSRDGKHDVAIKYYDIDIEASRSNNDLQGLAVALWNRALAKAKCARRSSSIDDAKEALKIFKECRHEKVEMVERWLESALEPSEKGYSSCTVTE